MSVVGISSDKIQPEGEYISPFAYFNATTGNCWTYRVFKSPKCEFYSIHKVFYQNGVYKGRAVSPEKLTGYSPEDLALLVARIQDAVEAKQKWEDRHDDLDRKATNLASYLFDNSFPACSWDDCEYYANELLYFGEGVPSPILELWKRYEV